MMARIGVHLASAVLALAALPAAAQEAKHLTLNGIASGTVAPHGMGFLSYSTSDTFLGGARAGTLSFGAGFGDAEDSIGFQVTAQVTELSGEFLGSGYLQLKAGRRLGDAPLYGAVQVDHLLAWGEAKQIDPKFKATLSYFTSLEAGGDSFPVMLSAGAGTDLTNNGQDPGVYFGAGIGLTSNIAASMAYSGEQFELGLGFKPSSRLSLSATLNDVFDKQNNRRVTLSVTYLFSDLFGG